MTERFDDAGDESSIVQELMFYGKGHFQMICNMFTLDLNVSTHISGSFNHLSNSAKFRIVHTEFNVK